MISQEKLMTLTHLQKLPKNVRDLYKLIVSKGFKKLPKVQKIAQSGHTAELSPLDHLRVPHKIEKILNIDHFTFLRFKFPVNLCPTGLIFRFRNVIVFLVSRIPYLLLLIKLLQLFLLPLGDRHIADDPLEKLEDGKPETFFLDKCVEQSGHGILRQKE